MEKRGKGRPRVGKGNGKKLGPMSAHHREKISKSAVLGRLIRHAEGKLKDASGPKSPMSASEVSAAIALIKKYLPDMSQSDVKVEADVQSTVATINIVGVDPDKVSEGE